MEENQNTPITPDEQAMTAGEPPRPRRRRSPYARNRRQQGTWLSWLLVGSAAIFLILGLLQPDKEFSDSENRKLAGLPDFSLGALADGSYLKGWSDYVADQFPGRDFWISVNLWMNKLTGQTLSNGVYLCDDGYLMQVPGTPDEENLERNIAAINEFAMAHKDLNLYMSVIPNAVTVHADKLPANAPVRDQIHDLKTLEAKLNGTKFLDVTQTLLDHRAEPLFYRTDHHWTSLGAFYAFEAIAPEMGITPPGAAGYSAFTVSNTFEGTLSSKSGSHSVQDVVEIYVPNTDVEYYVSYADTKEKICSVYDRDALNAKDHYTVFFGGNHFRLDILTTAQTGRNLLIFKDSYANCFVPLLYPYYEQIVMIDPRYYYDNLQTVVGSESITDVLYLYNADTFMTDSSLADVLSAG